MKHTAPYILFVSILGLAGLTGCGWKPGLNSFLDPSKPVQAPKTSTLMPIQTTTGLVDQTQELVPHATMPTEEDLTYSDADYVIGPTDVLLVTVLDLFDIGVEVPMQVEVQASGYIDLQELPERVRAEGYTALELRDIVVEAYNDAEILFDAKVTVQVVVKRQATFTATGAVPRPGMYNITRKQMTLMEALALAGGAPPNTKYIYIYRATPPTRVSAEVEEPPAVGPEKTGDWEQVQPTPLVPEEDEPSQTPPSESPAVEPSDKPAEQVSPQADPEEADDNEEAFREFQEALQDGDQNKNSPMLPAPSVIPHLTDTVSVPTSSPGNNENSESADSSLYKWIYSDGNWIRVLKESAAPSTKPSQYKAIPRTAEKAAPQPRVEPVAKVSPKLEDVTGAAPKAEPTEHASPSLQARFVTDVTEAPKADKVAKAAPKAKPIKKAAPKPKAKMAAKKTPKADKIAKIAPKTKPAKDPVPSQSALTTPYFPPPENPQIPSGQPTPRSGSTGPFALPPDEEQGKDPFGWQDAQAKFGRIIAVNLKSLNDGDRRMNVVIRENDIVHVPQVTFGVYYVGGEVWRPDSYVLTGQSITVKQALIGAGNISALAWPSNCILIRRIGHNQEQVIPLDVEGMFKGEENDIFLKPDDTIYVGTHLVAPFLAVMRNAFRLTYGFGFIYDRNFADPVPSGMNSRRFQRW